MIRLHASRPLAVVLAAGAIAAPAAAARPFHHPTPAPTAGHDTRFAASTPSPAGTTQSPASRNDPAAPSAVGIDAAPLAGGLATIAAAFAVGAEVTLRRRQARPVA